MLSEFLQVLRTDYEYEIDGIICIDDKIYPRSKGNPEQAFAFKMVIDGKITDSLSVASILKLRYLLNEGEIIVDQ